MAKKRRQPTKVSSCFDLLPPLQAADRKVLRASIAENGIQLPIIIDQQNCIIDGRARKEIADELGIRCPVVVRGFANDGERASFALTVNVARRHLSPAERSIVIDAYLIKDPHISDRWLAAILKVAPLTVKKRRDLLVAAKKIKRYDKLKGKDGKFRPSSLVIAHTEKEVEKASRLVEELSSDGNRKIFDLRTAKQQCRRLTAKATKALTTAGAAHLPQDMDLLHCRFQDLEIADESVDLLLTDFPYGGDFCVKEDEHSHRVQIDELAALAQRVLRPGGIFASYSGIRYLAKVLLSLGSCEDLHYRWVAASLHSRDEPQKVWCGPGKSPILNGWKPIIIFSKGDWTSENFFIDVLPASGKEKEWHKWQQPLPEAESLVSCLSKPGDLILDPCAGSFTNAIAAYRLGRRFIGCDRDPECVAIGRHRIAQEQSNRGAG